MLHPSYTDLMKVVNKDVRRRGNKDRQQSLFDRYGNIETCQTTDCRRPSACRCERGRETIVDRNRRIEQRRVEDQSRECGRRRVKTMRQNQTVSAFFMLADESCHIKVQK